MAVIAAEAEVGIATLYRRYPNREALLDTLTERAFTLLADVAADVVARGGRGIDQLHRWWEGVIDESDQLVLPLHGGPATLPPAAAQAQARLHASLRRIIATGHDDGTVCSAITFADVLFFGAMLVNPLGDRAAWPAIARRQRDVYLTGIAGPAAGGPHRTAPPH